MAAKALENDRKLRAMGITFRKTTPSLRVLTMSATM